MHASSPNPSVARRRRLLAFVVISALIATLAAVFSLFRFSLLPPGVEARQLQEGAAVTHAVVQLPPGQRPLTPTAFETQAKRANLIGNVMASTPVLERIGSAIGANPDRIEAETDINTSVPSALIEPDNERRASEIRTSNDPYRLDIQARPMAPVLDVYAEAPTAAGAEQLADASITATNLYLRRLARDEGERGPSPVLLRRLGAARGGSVSSTAAIEIGALTFLVTFGIVFGLLFLLAQVRRGWLRAGRTSRLPELENDTEVAPPGARTAGRDGDWPYTTRVLPWMIAGFIAMLWLLPINAITLEASLPVDLKLDRLVLPVVVVTWLLALVGKRPGAPRWRFTAIHAGIACFVAVAFFSVVLNAASLNQTLELEVAIKKLTLLAAFFSLFLVVSTTVRPAEVRPFMNLMLVLAVICAAGMLWEYRFDSNVFYDWSSKLLPGIFHVASVAGGYDEVGRREVVGPADLSLEAVAMLSMALPIAFTRLLEARRTRDKVLLGLAICLLFGAMLATYRKSALLAPIAICLVFAYFRRRELVRLAPVGLIVIVAMPFLAPNALGSIVDQFQPNRLGVATVSDRVSDYDAIRPDLLSHLAFGRGFGSYEHTSYRILDNDILMRIVETGLIGLTAFLLMIGLVFAIATPIVRRREGDRASTALAIAAAAVAFLVLSVLFDLMSFPHVPYIFLIFAGFLAVISQQRADRRGGAKDEPAPDPLEGLYADDWQEDVRAPVTLPLAGPAPR